MLQEFQNILSGVEEYAEKFVQDLTIAEHKLKTILDKEVEGHISINSNTPVGVWHKEQVDAMLILRELASFAESMKKRADKAYEALEKSLAPVLVARIITQATDEMGQPVIENGLPKLVPHTELVGQPTRGAVATDYGTCRGDIEFQYSIPSFTKNFEDYKKFWTGLGVPLNLLEYGVIQSSYPRVGEWLGSYVKNNLPSPIPEGYNNYAIVKCALRKRPKVNLLASSVTHTEQEVRPREGDMNQRTAPYSFEGEKPKDIEEDPF